MREAMEPTVCYVKGDKNSARLKHAKDFRESEILRFTRCQVVQHENGEHGGKSFVRKRQRGGVALNRFEIGRAHV